MPTSNTILPLWIVAPIGLLTLLVLAGHLLAVRAAKIDERRKRIRIATSALLMLTVPVFAYGLSGSTPARSREFVLVWLMVAVMLLFVILLALADMMHSWQLHRAQLRDLRRSLAMKRPDHQSSPQGADHGARG